MCLILGFVRFVNDWKQNCFNTEKCVTDVQGGLTRVNLSWNFKGPAIV